MLKYKILIIGILLWIFTPSQAQIGVSDSLIMNVRAKFSHQDFNSVFELLNPVSENIKTNSEPFILRGKAYLYAGQAGKAILDFELAEKIKENSASYELAQTYASVGNAEYACKALKKYLKTPHKKFQSDIKTDKYFEKISNSKPWIELWKADYYSKTELQLNDAQFEISKNNDAQAFSILDNIIAKNEKSTDALFMRAKLHAKNNDLKNALRDLDKTLKNKPFDTDYLLLHAQILFQTQKYQKALIDYDILIKKNKTDASFFKQKALIENELNDFENAKSDILTYLKFYPWDSEGLYIAGLINLKAEYYLDALKYFNESIEIDNSKSAYYEARGDAYFAVKTFENAENSFSMALDLVPAGEIFFKKGLARLAQNNIEGACSDWEKSLNLGYFRADDYLKKYGSEK